MSLCASCQADRHSHDRYTHSGEDAGCPNLAVTELGLREGCTCTVRLPAGTPGMHRCTCGNVHIQGGNTT